MIPQEFDREGWLKDHEAEQKRLLEETGGKEITIAPEEMRAAIERLRPEYEAWRRAYFAPVQPNKEDGHGED